MQTTRSAETDAQRPKLNSPLRSGNSGYAFEIHSGQDQGRATLDVRNPQNLDDGDRFADQTYHRRFLYTIVSDIVTTLKVIMSL